MLRSKFTRSTTRFLIAQVHRSATEARITAAQDLHSERVQQVKLGSTLEQDLIESRAQVLQAKQELLSTDLLLSDLKLQLNDAIGLPLIYSAGSRSQC